MNVHAPGAARAERFGAVARRINTHGAADTMFS